tara:strand:- start:5517 stop:6005 length:489 start_codon:yes stop_codon:yes gene_type:complete
LKKLALLLSALSLNCVAEDSNKEKEYSVGVGMGALYSGIGANFSFISKNDMKYISAGCTEYSSLSGYSCGFGAGWIKTDLFDFNSNKHGFGVYASLVGHETYATLNDQYSINDNDIYGAGVSYTYFMNGIDQSGTTFGLSIHATNADFEGRYGAFFQVGYQF